MDESQQIPILIVTTDSQICGTERMILALLRELNRERFEPYLVSMKGPGDLIAEAQAIGVHSLNLEIDAKGKLHGWREWRRVIKKTRPKLIHSYLFHSNLLSRLTKLLNPGVNVISGIRTVYTVEDYGRLYGLIERWTHRLDSLYVANSEQGRISAIHTIGLNERNVRMIPNGIDIDPFEEPTEEIRKSIRSEFGFSDQDFVFGIVAQLRPAKRHDLLIDALKKANTQSPTVRLLIVGGGEREPILRKQTNALQVHDSVTFAGYRNDARRILRGLDGFVLPSDVEGIPVSVMEAMEAGLPVIATRVGGVPDLIEDGVSGCLIDMGGVDALTQWLVRISTDKAFCAQLGAAARERLISEFSVEQMARRFEALYEEAVTITHS